MCRSIGIQVLGRIFWETCPFFRHLSLFDSYLRETADLTMRRFSETNYRLVFDILLKLLLSLRPKIYEETLSTPLENMLTSFFEFTTVGHVFCDFFGRNSIAHLRYLQRHVLRNQSLIGIVHQILDLAVGYIQFAAANARSFLQCHAVLMQVCFWAALLMNVLF